MNNPSIFNPSYIPKPNEVWKEVTGKPIPKLQTGLLNMGLPEIVEVIYEYSGLTERFATVRCNLCFQCDHGLEICLQLYKKPKVKSYKRMITRANGNNLYVYGYVDLDQEIQLMEKIKQNGFSKHKVNELYKRYNKINFPFTEEFCLDYMTPNEEEIKNQPYLSL